MNTKMKAIPAFIAANLIASGAHAAMTVVDDFETMTAGSGSIVVDVLANDVSNLGETFVFIESASSVSAQYGSVFLDQELNVITYIPPTTDFIGTDTFTYTAVDGDGSIYGGSATVTINVVAAPTPTPEVRPTPKPFESIVVGKTNQAVAKMLDGACAAAFAVSEESLNSAADLSSACGELRTIADESPEDLNQIMKEIAPEELLTQQRMLNDMSRGKTDRISRGLKAIRRGAPGALSINGQTIPLAGQANGGAAGDGEKSPWNFISALNYSGSEYDETVNAAGYDESTAGILLGLNYQLNRNLSIGGAVDLLDKSIDFAGNTGTFDSSNTSVSGFLSWYSRSLSADLQVGYGVGDSNSQRIITFPWDSVANADNSSSQFDVSGTVQWDYVNGAWTLSQSLRLDYVETTIDSYTETGDSLWLMNVEKQTWDQLNVALALELGRAISFDWGVMVPSVKVSMVKVANETETPVQFSLAGFETSGYAFTLETDAKDTMFYQWELNSVFVLKHGFSTFVSGQLLHGYENLSAYQVNGGINYEF